MSTKLNGVRTTTDSALENAIDYERKCAARLTLLPDWLKKLYREDPIVNSFVKYYERGMIDYDQMRDELIQTLVKAKNEAYDELIKMKLRQPVGATIKVGEVKDENT